MDTKIEELKNFITKAEKVGGHVNYDDLYKEFVEKRGWTSGTLSGLLNSLNEKTASGNKSYKNGGEVVTNKNEPKGSYQRIR